MARIDYQTAMAFLKNKHYSGRNPPTSFAFGLFVEGELQAVITYGSPPSKTLQEGVLGVDYKFNVIELNRMCRVEHCKIPMTQFIAYTLKELKEFNYVVVSFADTAMGHTGAIYQAANFFYTGKTKRSIDLAMSKYGHHRFDKNLAKEPTIRKVRSIKHRYIYFACDKKHKKLYMDKLRYPIKPYPKGDTKRYELGFILEPTLLDEDGNEYQDEAPKRLKSKVSF